MYKNLRVFLTTVDFVSSDIAKDLCAKRSLCWRLCYGGDGRYQPRRAVHLKSQLQHVVNEKGLERTETIKDG